MLLLTEVHTLLRFLVFICVFFFLFQESIQIPHYIRSSYLRRLLLVVTVSQVFLVFDDLDIFKEY